MRSAGIPVVSCALETRERRPAIFPDHVMTEQDCARIAGAERRVLSASRQAASTANAKVPPRPQNARSRTVRLAEAWGLLCGDVFPGRPVALTLVRVFVEAPRLIAISEDALVRRIRAIKIERVPSDSIVRVRVVVTASGVVPHAASVPGSHKPATSIVRTLLHACCTSLFWARKNPG